MGCLTGTWSWSWCWVGSAEMACLRAWIGPRPGGPAPHLEHTEVMATTCRNLSSSFLRQSISASAASSAACSRRTWASAVNSGIAPVFRVFVVTGKSYKACVERGGVTVPRDRKFWKKLFFNIFFTSTLRANECL